MMTMLVMAKDDTWENKSNFTANKWKPFSNIYSFSDMKENSFYAISVNETIPSTIDRHPISFVGNVCLSIGFIDAAGFMFRNRFSYNFHIHFSRFWFFTLLLQNNTSFVLYLIRLLNVKMCVCVCWVLWFTMYITKHKSNMTTVCRTNGIRSKHLFLRTMI